MHDSPIILFLRVQFTLHVRLADARLVNQAPSTGKEYMEHGPSRKQTVWTFSYNESNLLCRPRKSEAGIMTVLPLLLGT